MNRKGAYRVGFLKDTICKDLNKDQVASIFESYGLAFTMNEDESLMMLKETDTEDEYMVDMARLAVRGLACGLSAEWIEPILLEEIYCDFVKMDVPVGMSEEEFSSKYTSFVDKFDNLYGLQKKWNCRVFYFERCLFVVATSFEATTAVKGLVRESFFETWVFEDHVDFICRAMEEINAEEKALKNNLELFHSLLARSSMLAA